MCAAAGLRLTAQVLKVAHDKLVATAFDGAPGVYRADAIGDRERQHQQKYRQLTDRIEQVWARKIFRSPLQLEAVAKADTAARNETMASSARRCCLTRRLSSRERRSSTR